MNNPNLIKQALETNQKDPAKKLPGSLYVSMGLILFSALVYFAFFLIGMLFDSRASATEESIHDAETQIRTLNKEASEPRSFQDRLDNLAQLASDHLYWSGILTEVAEKTDRRVQYTSLTGDVELNMITLQARATDLAAVERNIVSLETSEKIKRVTSTSVVYNLDPKTQIVNVTFDLKLELVDGLLSEVPDKVETKTSNSEGENL